LQRGSARRSRPAPPPAGPIRLTPSPRGSAHRRRVRESRRRRWPPRDRKSTRLNSSHSQISYAVFCLKKKKKHSRDDQDMADLTHHHAFIATANSLNGRNLTAQRTKEVTSMGIAREHPQHYRRHSCAH